jgi:hypothetical protein
MLLSGQERASAPKSAVAAARGPGEHAISVATRHQVSGFSDADDPPCFAVNRRVAGSNPA